MGSKKPVENGRLEGVRWWLASGRGTALGATERSQDSHWHSRFRRVARREPMHQNQQPEGVLVRLLLAAAMAHCGSFVCQGGPERPSAGLEGVCSRRRRRPVAARRASVVDVAGVATRRGSR